MQRENTVRKLQGIRNRQKALRKDLSLLSQEGKLDAGTSEYLTGELYLLSREEEAAQKELDDAQGVQDKQRQLQERIAEFHRRCTQWREKLDDSEFIPLGQSRLDM